MEMIRKISGDYIAGFVDGEGCFSISFRKDKNKYFYWKAIFCIGLRNDDKEILEKIKDYFKCGSVSFSKDNVRYQISDTEILLNTIVPFFNKFELIGKKKNDFRLWEEALTLINKNKKKIPNSFKGSKGFVKNEWNVNDLNRLGEIRNKMNDFKSGGKNRTYKYLGT